MTRDHLDLFSGIGGFALAARWAGLKTVQFVEIDPFCQKVLAKQFPGVPIHDDITTYTYRNGLQEPRAKQQTGGDRQLLQDRPPNTPFLLTGGFPCQPFSCAGKRRGKEDDRYLWPEMLRVVSEAKPTWIIGENVAGFINMGLDDCISDLEAEGYEVQAFVIPACAVNAPHRRDRVWIVGYSERGGSYGEKISIPIGRSQQESPLLAGADRHVTDSILNREKRDKSKYGPRWMFTENDCASPHSPQRQDHGRDGRGMDGAAEGREGINAAAGVGNTDVADTEQQRRWEHGDEQGRGNALETVRGGQWSTPWPEVAARLCRVDARVSNRVDRLKALGNAIVPQVAFEIMTAALNI